MRGYEETVLTGDALLQQVDALINIGSASTTWSFKRDLINALFVARVQPAMCTSKEPLPASPGMAFNDAQHAVISFTAWLEAIRPMLAELNK